MNTYQETELKLRLTDPSLCESIAADPQLDAMRAGRTKDSAYDTVYYDTADRRLWGRGFSLRLRNTGEGYIATVKNKGTSYGGLAVRGEWNVPLPDDVLSVHAFADLPVGNALREAVDGKPLVPVVRTVFRRISVDLELDGTLIELAVDKGEIIAGDRRQPLCEVELELKAGDADVLLQLGAVLKMRWPLVPERKSKYARGLMLAEMDAT
jgi:inorganic triphosphatase YgiF